ncbi:MAG: hypothetical protein LAO56_24530 [Acidobacteriia bacterium]|nr:hypothetical protein [Terriglobia bacterium]
MQMGGMVNGPPNATDPVHGGNLDGGHRACDAPKIGMARKSQKSNKRPRAPRIRVPNSERALFAVDAVRFVGVLQRLSLTGGSAVLSKGPIPQGTMGDIALSTVFGRVDAKIEFLQTGADGVPLAQAFRFIAMDDTSTERFDAAAKQMQEAGFSDTPEEEPTGLAGAHTLNRLLDSVRRLAATLVAAKSAARS